MLRCKNVKCILEALLAPQLATGEHLKDDPFGGQGEIGPEAGPRPYLAPRFARSPIALALAALR